MDDSELVDLIAIYGAAWAVTGLGSWLGFFGLICCLILDWLTPEDRNEAA